MPLLATSARRVFLKAHFVPYGPTLPKIIVRNYAMPNNSVPKLKDPSLFRQECYVNGEWVKAKSGKTFDVHGMFCSIVLELS